MSFLLRVVLSLLACIQCTALAATQALTEVGANKVERPDNSGAHPTESAEARLIAIYRMIGQGDTRSALNQAGKLVQAHPNFALAQLVYADLLSARTRPLSAFGDAPVSQLQRGQSALTDLRNESLLRLKALRERPPSGALPAAFLKLSARNKHAIAIDASRARLYLFENKPSGTALVADYYVSVGKLGLGKEIEGDQRTPLGVYFITSQLDPKTLRDFYGSGALPINYPNVLDIKRGKTGSGIWLHGTPPDQFARAPLASDGCVVLSNPDLKHLIGQVEIRSTPVLIAKQLQWVAPSSLKAPARDFTNQLDAWLKAKSSANLHSLTTFYASDFNSNGKSLADWLPLLQQEISKLQGKSLAIKDLSLLHWKDTHETMVVTFGEVAIGQFTGQTWRQYWRREGAHWIIFYEGVLS